MRRSLLNFATVLSLLLCVAAAALWVQSYRQPRAQMFGRHEVLSVRGQLHYYWWHFGFHTGLPDTRWHHLGFGFFRGNVLWVRVPYWFLALLPALSPVTWGFRRLRRRWGPGLCPLCGYDLRATPDRCPECGGVVPAQTAA